MSKKSKNKVNSTNTKKTSNKVNSTNNANKVNKVNSTNNANKVNSTNTKKNSNKVNKVNKVNNVNTEKNSNKEKNINANLIEPYDFHVSVANTIDKKISKGLRATYKAIEMEEKRVPILYTDRFSHIYIYESITNGCVRRIKNEIIDLSNIQKNILNEGEYDEQTIYTLPKPIIIHIHSEGGDINAGIALSNIIDIPDVPVIVIAEGVVASAATFVLIKAKLSYVLDNAFILIHQSFGELAGQQEELQFSVDIGTQFVDFLVQLYSEHTNLKQDQIRKMLKHDVFMSADDAMKFGLVNYKIKENVEMKYDFYDRNEAFTLRSKDVSHSVTFFNNLNMIKTDEEAKLEMFEKSLSLVKRIHNLSYFQNSTPLYLHLSDATSSDFYSRMVGVIPVLNAIAVSRVPIYGIVTGPINNFSILIFVILYKRYMYRNTFFTIDFVTYQEESYKFEDSMLNTEFIRKIIMNIFITKTKLPQHMLDNLFSKRFAIYPDDALKYGMTDNIID